MSNAKKAWKKLTNNKMLKKATGKIGEIKNNLIFGVEKSFNNFKNSNMGKKIGNIKKRLRNSKVVKKNI